MLHKDYRYQEYQAIITLTEDSTNPNSAIAGRQVGAVIAPGETQYDAEHVLSFPLPNVTAMCLDVAYKTWAASQHSLQDKDFYDLSSPLLRRVL